MVKDIIFTLVVPMPRNMHFNYLLLCGTHMQGDKFTNIVVRSNDFKDLCSISLSDLMDALGFIIALKNICCAHLAGRRHVL